MIHTENINFASVCGCLMVIASRYKQHQRRYKLCEKVRLSLDKIAHTLPRVSTEDLNAAEAIFGIVEQIVEQVCKDGSLDTEDVLAALILFNLEEIKITKNVMEKVNSLIDCYPKIQDYEVMKSANIVWDKISEEINNQEKGVKDIT